MMDFSKCPQDKHWLLFDSTGYVQYIVNEVMFNYARLQIAKGRLEGYYLVRHDDWMTKPKNEIEKYPINHYGVVKNRPDDMFNSNDDMASQILFTAMKTKKDEEKAQKESRIDTIHKFSKCANPKLIMERMGYVYDERKSNNRNCVDFLKEMKEDGRMDELARTMADNE